MCNKYFHIFLYLLSFIVGLLLSYLFYQNNEKKFNTFSPNGKLSPNIIIEQKGYPSGALNLINEKTPWCSKNEAVNYISHREKSPTIKVIYLHFSDYPNRFKQVARLLNTSSFIINDYVHTQSDNKKIIRFDRGTNCGKHYLDVGYAKLPHNRNFYLKQEYAEIDDFSKKLLDRDTEKIKPQFSSGVANNPRYYLYYVDMAWPSNISGIAIMSNQNWPGASEQILGKKTAYVYGPETLNKYPHDNLPEIITHEIFHMLGAVQEEAPNSTSAGHCIDMQDLMCYEDKSHPILNNKCLNIQGLISKTLDCGRDDYFNPSPTANSYLSKHWNTYNSPFLIYAPNYKKKVLCNFLYCVNN